MMVKITIRIPRETQSRLIAFSARRGLTVSQFSRRLLESGIGLWDDPIFKETTPPNPMTRPVLQRLLAGVLACEEMCRMDFDQAPDRLTILKGIEGRVIKKVGDLLEAGTNGWELRNER